MTSDGDQRAVSALERSGIAYAITHHGPVQSLQEAAAARGVGPRDIDRGTSEVSERGTSGELRGAVIKTLVVRRGEGDYLFVLVPGDREISWPKLRAHLGVNRLSMPGKDVARAVTGYERGTITPFGSTSAWPVVADATVAGRTISIGAGAHGVAATASGDDVIRALGAEVEDVTEPVAGQHD